jgi:hypothetical protein
VGEFWGEHPVVFVLLVFFAIGCFGAAAQEPDRVRLMSREDLWPMWRVWSSQHPDAMGREGREPPESKGNFWGQIVCLLLGLATIGVLVLVAVVW